MRKISFYILPHRRFFGLKSYCFIAKSFYSSELNHITSDFYNKIINNLQFHQLKCPCGHSGCLSIHGYYNRYIKSPDGKLCLRICRVKCECCCHTHAILLSSMVPYSQVSTAEHISIIENYNNNLSQDSVMENNPLIDESNYRYIIKCYLKHWHEKLRSECLTLKPVFRLIKSCFAHFSRQFMQIKRTINMIISITT